MSAGRTLRWEIEGSVAPLLLERGWPDIAAAVAESGASAETLRPLHDKYVSDVSTPVMAVSLVTAGVLLALCERLLPRRILDLGSGFSTAVFARWSVDRVTSLVSYDDDEDWLARTAGYLQTQSLAVPDLRKLRHGASLPGDNDLVFLDAGLPPERIGLFASAAASLSPNGVLVIDDVNQHPFGAQVRVGALPNGLKLFSLRRQTLDAFGRFSALAVQR